MKAVTFYFQNMEPTQSLHKCAFPFLTFIVDLTFGKILNILEESQQVNYLGIQLQFTCKRFDFYKCADEYPLKDAEENSSKKSVITLIFNLKSPVISTNFDHDEDI